MRCYLIEVITYNDGTSTKVGNPINYIMRTAISADYHLLVLFDYNLQYNYIKNKRFLVINLFYNK